MDAKDPFDKTYQIALGQNIEHGWFTVWVLPMPGNYVRVSKPVTITFSKDDNDEVVQEAMKAIDALEREARSELNRKLSEFADRRASLLALTYQPDK